MGVHYVSSRDFSRDPGRAKKAADEGAVFITNRDQPTHVLMRIEDFRRMSGEKGSIVDKLASPGLADIEFEIPRATIGLKPADLD